MKYIWEENDIRGGREVQKPDTGITGRHMIGYRYRDYKGEPRPEAEATLSVFYGLFSLADGMWIPTGDGSKQAVADWLNRCGYYHPVGVE